MARRLCSETSWRGFFNVVECAQQRPWGEDCEEDARLKGWRGLVGQTCQSRPSSSLLPRRRYSRIWHRNSPEMSLATICLAGRTAGGGKRERGGGGGEIGGVVMRVGCWVMVSAHGHGELGVERWDAESCGGQRPWQAGDACGEGRGTSKARAARRGATHCCRGPLLFSLLSKHTSAASTRTRPRATNCHPHMYMHGPTHTCQLLPGAGAGLLGQRKLPQELPLPVVHWREFVCVSSASAALPLPRLHMYVICRDIHGCN